MTLFNPEINSIEEDILYHETQIQEAQERLDQVKLSQAYSDTVISSLEDFFENTDPFLYEVLKGHIDQMFKKNKVTLNNDLKEVKEESHTESESVFDTPQGIIEREEKPEKEFGPLSYHELTGRPDVRPDTYEDLAPNITYSSSGRAYAGFNDKQEAQEFSNSISEPSMIGDTDTLNGYKYEVKFYCTKEFIEDIVNDWTPEQKAELDWQEQLLHIAPDIFYDPSSSKCFMGFSNRGRANTYGAHLKEIHELYDSRYTVDKPTVVTNCKHELVIECITEDDSRKLAPLNLKKELEHKSNKAITDTWLLPLKKEDIEEGEYPAPPYNKIPLDQVEICDVVTTSPNSQSAYEVTGNKGTHLLATCLYNKSLPHREGQKDFWIKEAYLVQKADDVPLAS